MGLGSRHGPGPWEKKSYIKNDYKTLVLSN